LANRSDIVEDYAVVALFDSTDDYTNSYHIIDLNDITFFYKLPLNAGMRVDIKEIVCNNHSVNPTIIGFMEAVGENTDYVFKIDINNLTFVQAKSSYITRIVNMIKDDFGNFRIVGSTMTSAVSGGLGS